MKKIICFGMLMISVMSLFSQNDLLKTADSLYLKNQDYKQAVQYYEKYFSASDSINNDALYSWGYCCFMLKDYNKSIELCQKALEKYNNESNYNCINMAQTLLAIDYRYSGNINQAIKYYELSLSSSRQGKLRPSPTSALNLASCYYDNKQYDKVISMLEEWEIFLEETEYFENLQLLYGIKADAYRRLSSKKSAIIYYQKAIDIIEKNHINDIEDCNGYKNKIKIINDEINNDDNKKFRINLFLIFGLIIIILTAAVIKIKLGNKKINNKNN